MQSKIQRIDGEEEDIKEGEWDKIKESSKQTMKNKTRWSEICSIVFFFRNMITESERDRGEDRSWRWKVGKLESPFGF